MKKSNSLYRPYRCKQCDYPIKHKYALCAICEHIKVLIEQKINK